MDEPERRRAEALRFAAAQLGPASEALLARPAPARALVELVGEGVEPADAALAVVFAAAKTDAALADEFLRSFLVDLGRLASSRMAADCRRQFDSEDLVVSILGDLWRQVETLEFTTRGAFLSLLATRLRWKLGHKRDAARAAKRREDRRVFPGLDREWSGDHPSPGPATEAAAAEERSRRRADVARLQERDRLLLQALLDGLTLDEIAERFELDKEAARLAIKRAVARLAPREGAT